MHRNRPDNSSAAHDLLANSLQSDLSRTWQCLAASKRDVNLQITSELIVLVSHILAELSPA